MDKTVSDINNFLKNNSNMLNAIKNIESVTKLKPISVPTLNIRNYHLADYQHQVIMECIKKFEENLDNDHEVAVKLASFGQTILLSVTSIGYSNPSLIHFYGYVNDQYSELIQHVSQLNFLLMSVEKDNPDREARRIGFNVDDCSCESRSDNE